MKMLLKPHRLLLILAAAICGLEFIRTLIWGDNYSVDFPWHDTFYIVSFFQIALLSILLLLGMAFLYKMGAQSQFTYNKWLTLGHCTSISLFILTFTKLAFVSSNIPRRYYSFGSFVPMESIYENIDFLNNCLLMFALSIALFFALNLIIGYFKRIK